MGDSKAVEAAAGDIDAGLARAATEAGLTIATADELTIRRRRAGKGFVYLDAKGKRIAQEATLARIRSLAIPPAYEDVRVAADETFHLQAIGKDEAGRTQYRYHPDWDAVRETRKVERLDRVIEALPKLRRAVAADMASPRLGKRKALASAVALIDETHIRVGSEAYLRSNKAHGAATLLKRHVKVRGESVELSFRGKGGKDVSARMRSPRLARALARIGALPGRRLFQYRDEDDKVRRVTAVDVNAYLRDIAGEGVTDFEKYRMDPTQPLAPCFFTPDVPPPPKGVVIAGKRDIRGVPNPAVSGLSAQETTIANDHTAHQPSRLPRSPHPDGPSRAAGPAARRRACA